MEPLVFLKEDHTRFSFLSSHQYQSTGYFKNMT